MTTEHVDILIIGAGISGIGAAYHLNQNCPGRSYVILEGREAIGGTWDLFRYPGIRSDSDMYTLGYRFKPWEEQKSIADGPSILKYLHETAQENNITGKIRFGHQVGSANWSTQTSRWTVQAMRGEEAVEFTCNFLFLCGGYYKYEAGYTPDFAGTERFKGRIAHPQFWTEDIDYKDKQVLIIGSGATAVTLVPAMAKQAAHVTMVQRSPTYMFSLPAVDRRALWLRKYLPPKLAYRLIRWRNILFGLYVFNRVKRKPEQARRLLLDHVQKKLGPDYDIETHFTPHYKPWDQRLCLVPDDDFFDAIKDGHASVVTDHIETFTEDGLKLASGKELKADLIVTATGLELEVFNGIDIRVDDVPVKAHDTMSYKGMMYSDVPNLASSFGYTNASWTLKCDLTCDFVCRLLNYMERKGVTQCTPRLTDPSVEEAPWLDFSSGYVQRSIHLFPKQGTKGPWRLRQNYLFDIFALRFGKMDDGALEFSNPKA